MREPERSGLGASQWGREVVRRAAVAGSFASLLSTAAIALRSKADGDSLFCGTNATSHWVWGERAYHRQGFSLRYTVTGYLIHHICAVFWAVLFMIFRHRKGVIPSQTTATRQPAPRPDRGTLADGRCRDAASAAAMAALAAAVDYTGTPHRLRPGYERHLRVRSLFGVYAAFAVGLFIATRCLDQGPRRGQATAIRSGNASGLGSHVRKQ